MTSLSLLNTDISKKNVNNTTLFLQQLLMINLKQLLLIWLIKLLFPKRYAFVRKCSELLGAADLKLPIFSGSTAFPPRARPVRVQRLVTPASPARGSRPPRAPRRRRTVLEVSQAAVRLAVDRTRIG